jgi:hypothetical protein
MKKLDEEACVLNPQRADAEAALILGWPFQVEPVYACAPLHPSTLYSGDRFGTPNTIVDRIGRERDLSVQLGNVKHPTHPNLWETF